MRMYTLWSLGYAVRTVLILHAIPLRIEEAKSQRESRPLFFCSGEVRQFDNWRGSGLAQQLTKFAAGKQLNDTISVVVFEPL